MGFFVSNDVRKWCKRTQEHPPETCSAITCFLLCILCKSDQLKKCRNRACWTWKCQKPVLSWKGKNVQAKNNTLCGKLLNSRSTKMWKLNKTGAEEKLTSVLFKLIINYLPTIFKSIFWISHFTARARNQTVTIKILSIGIHRSAQTVQTHFRLLLKEQFWSGSTQFAILSASIWH